MKFSKELLNLSNLQAENTLDFSIDTYIELMKMSKMYGLDFSDIEKELKRKLIAPLAELKKQEETHGKKIDQTRKTSRKKESAGFRTSKNQ